MKVKFVDLKRQDKKYKTEFMNVIEKVVDNADFIMGQEVIAFEKQFAAYCNKKYCVTLNSGTDALQLVLIAYGIKKGDEVITVPNSYFSTAMVISNIGAVPVFVDIDKDSYNMDPKLIEARITNRTKAIIPVHLYGQAADMDPIITIANKYKLTILEDCCQAHGAKYKGKIVPIVEAGAFSFYPGKNLGAFGDGGAVVTNNKEISNNLEYLRNDGSKIKYEHKMLGSKSRLDTIQAAILSIKLKYLSLFVEKRRIAAKLYTELLQSIPQIRTPKEINYGKHAYHIYAIICKHRDALQKYLKRKEIETVIHYPTPIHLQEAYSKLRYKTGDFPNAEYLAENELSLPMFPEITNEEIEYVVRNIKNFYSS